MYFDLVLVAQPMSKAFLCRCPSFSYLKLGDQVMVEGIEESQVATVIDSLTLAPDDEEFSFILKATHSALPLPKIVSKIEYRKYHYVEEDHDIDEEEK